MTLKFSLLMSTSGYIRCKSIYTDRLMEVKYCSRKSLACRSTSSLERGTPVLRVCSDTTLPRHACCEHWDGCGGK